MGEVLTVTDTSFIFRMKDVMTIAAIYI